MTGLLPLSTIKRLCENRSYFAYKAGYIGCGETAFSTPKQFYKLLLQDS